MPEQNQRILVLGKNGQIARALGELLGHKAYLAGRDELDFTHTESFAPLLERIQPQAVINAIAYTQVDKAETDVALAEQVNTTAPALWAELCNNAKIPFVHFSTDYVFNGNGNKPFIESDSPAPLNVYGRTKLAGEQAILEKGSYALIFRTSWVYDATGKNFFNTMLRLGAEREELAVVADQTGAPSYAPHIAEATLQALTLATHQQPFPSGIYHLCNQGEISWHGFAEAIFAEARKAGMPLKVKLCRAITSAEYPTPALRPLNSRLDCSKLAQTLDVTLPHWKEGLVEAIALKRTLLQAA